MLLYCWQWHVAKKYTEHIVAFPLQQWLLERAKMVRHTYIANLVLSCFLFFWGGGDSPASKFLCADVSEHYSIFVGGVNRKNNRNEIVGVFIREKVGLKNSLSHCCMFLYAHWRKTCPQVKWLVSGHYGYHSLPFPRIEQQSFTQKLFPLLTEPYVSEKSQFFFTQSVTELKLKSQTTYLREPTAVQDLPVPCLRILFTDIW